MSAERTPDKEKTDLLTTLEEIREKQKQLRTVKKDLEDCVEGANELFGPKLEGLVAILQDLAAPLQGSEGNLEKTHCYITKGGSIQGVVVFGYYLGSMDGNKLEEAGKSFKEKAAKLLSLPEDFVFGHFDCIEYPR